jgi:hypothetical protein
MEVANTLAYYDTVTITVLKSFIVQAPGPNVLNLFTSIIYECQAFPDKPNVLW